MYQKIIIYFKKNSTYERKPNICIYFQKITNRKLIRRTKVHCGSLQFASFEEVSSGAAVMAIPSAVRQCIESCDLQIMGPLRLPILFFIYQT